MEDTYGIQSRIGSIIVVERWYCCRGSPVFSDRNIHRNAIECIKAYDWAWFCSQRVYHNRIQNLPAESFDETIGQSTLFQKFSSLSKEPLHEELFYGRLAWVNSIEDPQLYRGLKRLSTYDLELLTLIVFEGYKKSEVAEKLGCSRSAITQRMKKIKKNLENA